MAARPVHLLDLNVLIALSWPQHVHHERAHRWFGGRGRMPWATTPTTEAGFLRLSLNSAVVHRSLAAADVLAALAAIRSLPGHTFVPDGSSLAAPQIDLRRLVASRQITDLHLVNVAASTGAMLATFDAAIVDYLEPPDRSHVVVLP